MTTCFNSIKERIFYLSYCSQEGHVPSALSILDILWVLYDEVLNLKLIKSKSLKRDYFILSKGHGCLALYAVLEKKNFFKKNQLSNFCKEKSIFGGHPDSCKVPGIECSSGSLGHGLPFAVGIAYSNKINNIKSKTYVLIGDQESNEGSIWESFLLASNYELDNLICIIDNNESSKYSTYMNRYSKKLQSFDWSTIEVDGHNINQIKKALTVKVKNKPLAIIAKTTKGKGGYFLEKNSEWHHKPINYEMYIKLKKKLYEKSICKNS